MRRVVRIEQEDLFGIYNSTDDKEQCMLALYRSAADCRSCPNWKSRSKLGQIAAWDGTWNNPDLFLISEAPGIIEQKKGKPFQGPSGDLLDRILRKLGTSRAQCFLTNVTLCKPLGEEREFPVSVLSACRIHWVEMMKIIQPRIVVTLGLVAVRAMFPESVSSDTTMSELDGSERPLLGSRVISTYHPAYFLRGAPDIIEKKMREEMKTWSTIKLILENIRNEHSENLDREANCV